MVVKLPWNIRIIKLCLIITNSHSTNKCLKISWDASKLLINAMVMNLAIIQLIVMAILMRLDLISMLKIV